MKKLFTFSAAMLLFVLFSFASGYAQLSEGGIPYSFNHSIPSVFHSVTLPSVDVQRLLAEDRLEESKGLPYRFGAEIPVNYTLENSGTWYYAPDGSKVWRLKITSTGASTINLIYNDYWLPKGAKFYIYNEQRTEIIGAFTNRNNKEDGQFATGLVRGETMILEYYEPANLTEHGIISVSYVIHGYKDAFAHIKESDDFGGSGPCEINVNCPVGAPWQNEKRGVAVVLTSNGSRICSGSMINNVRQDLKKYFLTANHCSGGGGTSNWIIMFNYESPNCSIIDGPLNYTIHGTTLKANNSASDFYLVELVEAVPDSYQVHYAGFNATDVPATNGVGIHHPDCDIKKISFAPNPFENGTWSGTPANSHWKVIWTTDGSLGVTEPGSSGSPIYDQNHRIMGQLHGGPSSCTASDKSDFYGKLSMSWDYGSTPQTRLKDWLDPDNTGTRIVDGWDPTMGNPDTVAPTRITDLAVVSPTSSSLLLTWTAPLDTSFGGVTGYDIRKSTTPITDTITFYAATQIPYSGAIGTAGTPQSQLVSNLSFSTTYYFAIRSKDRWNNRSLISNVPNGITWAAPVVHVTPDSMHHELIPNQTIEDSLMLSNNASQPSTLEYSVTLENNTFPSGLVNLQLIPMRKESEMISYIDKNNPPVHQGQSILGGGGPDAFGYKWIDSDDPNGPQYVWEDISTTGTEVTNWVATGTFDPKDEGIAGPYPLGFNFKYYGQVKDAIHISTNGLIKFATVTGYNIFSNTVIPNTANPNDIICPFWDDLDGRNGGNVYVKQDGSRFIVQFNNWPKYSGSGSLTFQVVIYSSGKIMFYYKSLTATVNTCTVGIENGDGTVGLQVVSDASYLHDALAVKFSAEPDWLGGNNLSGILNYGTSAAIRMTFRSEDFQLGDYHMDVMIASNDPVTPLKRVPVTMKISAVPVELTSLSADAIDNDVVLKWQTATELNNSGFAVERSSAKTAWNEVTFVKGSGSSTEQKVYSFRDKNLPVGKYSYRLRQVDYDGTIKYSTPIEIDVKAPEKFALMQNYPNPFNPDTRIKFSLPVKSQVRLTIFNTLGEKVAEPFTGNMEAGYHELSFSASKLSSGTYFYRIEAGNFIETKKMSVLK